MENDLPVRKRNRLESHDYSTPGAYFITVCTKERRNCFWKKRPKKVVGEDIILPPQKIELSPYGAIVEDAIQNIPKQYSNIELMQYVVMPNHIHMVLRIMYNGGRMISSPTTVSISTVVGQMKRYASKRTGHPIWQRSFHDHVIRDRRDYDEIAKYIYENPMKWQDDCFYCED